MHDITAGHAVVAHDESKAPYFVVWGALLALTAIEVALAYKQVFTPLHMLEVLMALSVVKSALIIGYFMHLKFEATTMKWILMISLVLCLTLMFVFFADAFRILSLGAR